MATLSQFVQYSRQEGRPIEHGDTVVTPVSQVLSVRLPHYRIVWNRPSSIIVNNGGTTSELAIVDVTLLVQIGMLATGVVALVIALVAGRAGKK